jgi:hypothetical protein
VTWTREKAAAAAARSRAFDSSKYERTAVQAFWGDAAFMRECAPSNGPVASPFEIYLEILPNGRIGRSLFVPETTTAKCVKERTAGRVFPKRSRAFVLQIAMSFKP